jgi:hypothetical protein
MDTTRLDVHGLDPLTLRWVRVTTAGQRCWRITHSIVKRVCFWSRDGKWASHCWNKHG